LGSFLFLHYYYYCGNRRRERGVDNNNTSLSMNRRGKETIYWGDDSIDYTSLVAPVSLRPMII
tara:strand:- start:91 stop:279 length:189 start_codon:yes stop_codon:yes gene_type:complete